MNFRTDLALERREILGSKIKGVLVNEIKREETKTTVIDIKTEEAAEKLGKGIGKYITVEMDSFSYSPQVTSERLEALKESIGALIPKGDGTVLVAGVGNSELTSDSLGPKTAGMIFATRHIDKNTQKEIGFTKKLFSVSAIQTGVLGQTGVESGEFIKSICDTIKPKCVITIDALASKNIKRIGTTVQMSNTGIAPGSGIGNSRVRIDEKLLGIPVIAIGVPTVVSAYSLVENMVKSYDSNLKIKDEENMIVAPKDIDIIIKNSSYLLALAINCALQKDITAEEMYALM